MGRLGGGVIFLLNGGRPKEWAEWGAAENLAAEVRSVKAELHAGNFQAGRLGEGKRLKTLMPFRQTEPRRQAALADLHACGPFSIIFPAMEISKNVCSAAASSDNEDPEQKGWGVRVSVMAYFGLGLAS